jgi:hypothetical protein
VIIVEQAGPARDRRFLAERPHDECAARDFSAAMCASVASTSVVAARDTLRHDSMEASQWEVD